MIPIKSNQLSTMQNLCSQGNTGKANKTNLLQCNHLVIIGLEHIYKDFKDVEYIPISININGTGEIEIVGLEENIINNSDNIRIYTDKKVTSSKR